MALPALRQPKLQTVARSNAKRQVIPDGNYVILTLKNDKKLVVTSNAYHGIINEEGMYKCVFCATSMELNCKNLEVHKNSLKHKGMMADIPYINDFADHLVRQINKDESYCTICNVLLFSYSVPHHIVTEAHSQEVDKAYARTLNYKPYSMNVKA